MERLAAYSHFARLLDQCGIMHGDSTAGDGSGTSGQT